MPAICCMLIFYFTIDMNMAFEKFAWVCINQIHCCAIKYRQNAMTLNIRALSYTLAVSLMMVITEANTATDDVCAKMTVITLRDRMEKAHLGCGGC